MTCSKVIVIFLDGGVLHRESSAPAATAAGVFVKQLSSNIIFAYHNSTPPQKKTLQKVRNFLLAGFFTQKFSFKSAYILTFCKLQQSCEIHEL